MAKIRRRGGGQRPRFTRAAADTGSFIDAIAASGALRGLYVYWATDAGTQVFQYGPITGAESVADDRVDLDFGEVIDGPFPGFLCYLVIGSNTPAGGAIAPAKPATPTVSGITTSAATVSWVAPFDGGDAITTYWLRYREVGTQTWTTDNLGLFITAGIAGLDSGTDYEVQVRATNGEGDGPYSDSATFTTLSQPPPPPPPPPPTPFGPRRVRSVDTWEIDWADDGYQHAAADVTAGLSRLSIPLRPQRIGQRRDVAQRTGSRRPRPRQLSRHLQQ